MPQHHFIISPRLSVGRRQKASNAVCQVIITESHSKSTIDSAALEVIRRYSVCVCAARTCIEAGGSGKSMPQ